MASRNQFIAVYHHNRPILFIIIILVIIIIIITTRSRKYSVQASILGRPQFLALRLQRSVWIEYCCLDVGTVLKDTVSGGHSSS